MKLRLLLWLALALLASACSPTRPDLTRLYLNARRRSRRSRR
jgi:hypothetical protein